MTPSVVSILWKQFKDTRSIQIKALQCPPIALMANEVGYLSIIARHNRCTTASQVFRDLYVAAGSRVSRVIVFRKSK